MLELMRFKGLSSRKYYLLLVIFIIMIIIGSKIKDKYISNIYTTYGMVECNEECIISISLDYSKIDILKSSTLYIDDSKVKINNYEYGEIYLNDNIPVQEIKLYPDSNLEEKIVKVKIEYKKQRIISKIKNIIIER